MSIRFLRKRKHIRRQSRHRRQHPLLKKLHPHKRVEPTIESSDQSAEKHRARARFFFEHDSKNYRAVIGVDEVGRGALFGPVTVGAVLVERDQWDILLQEKWFAAIKDSKQISANKRRELSKLLRSAVPHAVAHTAVRYIDKFNISRAVERGMYKAVQRLLQENSISHCECRVLFDGKYTPKYPQLGMARSMPLLHAEIKADQKYFPVSAASIIAKVARDDLIARATVRYPGYGLDAHAGYGTEAHRKAIAALGLTKFHRKSFRIQT